MKRRFLEEMGLQKEQVDRILDENSQDIGKWKGDAEALQGRVETATSEMAALKKQLTERDSQLETLKNSTDNPEALKQTIATLQADNKAKDDKHAAEIKQLKVDAAIEAALSGAKAKNARAVRALLDIDLEKIKVKEDGTLDGLSLDDQIKKLQGAEDSKFLFNTETKFTLKGARPAETGKEWQDGKVDTSTMTYEELCAYMEAGGE